MQSFGHQVDMALDFIGGIDLLGELRQQGLYVPDIALGRGDTGVRLGKFEVTFGTHD